MSERIQAAAIELLWRQWTAVGVAGVAPLPEQALDLEAMIAFTGFVAQADPRLADESLDWCTHVGKDFISISRLRQIQRQMPPLPSGNGLDLAARLLDKAEAPAHRLSKKSRPPGLELPCLVQLRSRYIFGVGARADVVARLVMQGQRARAQMTSALVPTGYTKQAVATILDELAHAGVVKKLLAAQGASYELVKEAPLKTLLAPLPDRASPWVERFVIVAHILQTWRELGGRATYVIELAKALHGMQAVVAAAGERAPSRGRPQELLTQIERWAVGLVQDDVWDDAWFFDHEDIGDEISRALRERLVETIQQGDYSVGHTEIQAIRFRTVDLRAGTSRFTARFTAAHPREDFGFDGHVEGSFTFDPAAEDKASLLASLQLTEAHAHFELDDA